MSFDQARGGGEFAHLAQLMLRSKGDSISAAAMAEGNRFTPRRVTDVLKAAVGSGSLSDPTWAGNLADYRIVAEGFLESLRSLSVFDRLLSDGLRRIPLRTRLAVVSAAISGHAVAEGAMKPVGRLTLAGPLLDPLKTVAIIVITDELARNTSSAAATLISRELRGAVAAATDEVFLGVIGLGLTPIVSVDPLTDLAALLGAINTTATSRLYWVLTPDDAKALVTMTDTAGALTFPGVTVNGGDIGGVTLLVSDQLSAGTSMLIDASGLVGDSDVITLDASEHADVVMNDSPSGGAQTVTSMFQTGSRALKAERFFGVEIVRANKVAVLSGVSY